MAAREVSPEAAISAGLPLTGSLAVASALRLFGLAAGAQASGELSISSDGRKLVYTLFFRRGTVEYAGSSDPADDLGRFLLRKGVLTPEKLVLVESARQGAGGDLVGALIATQVVHPSDVAGYLLERGVGVISRALACEAGSYSWEPGVPPPASSFPLGTPFASLCAAVRALDVSSIQRRLGERAKSPASRMVGRIKLEELRLTPQEARAVGLFDGSRSPSEIAAAQPGDAGVVLRLALLLGELDLLTFGAPRASSPPPATARPAASPAPPASVPTPAVTSVPSSVSAQAPAPAAPPPQAAAPARPVSAPPPPVAPPPGTPGAQPPPAVAPRPAPAPAAASSRTPPPSPAAQTPAPRPAVTPISAAQKPAAAPRPAAPPHAAVGLDVEVLRALLEKQKAEDHFQVLGVKRDSPAAAVKVAYFQLARSYHPDAVPAEAPPEARTLCADVFARISEAWAVLGDEGRRAKYLQELQSGGAADVDVMRILHAETVFQEATALVKVRRYDEAMAKLREAMELNADEPEFGVWKAWCEFLLSQDKKHQLPTSAAAIEAALKKNPKCTPAYLFLGQMAKVVGDLNLAEKHLKRGLQVVPDHPEIARELKYLRR